VQGREGALSREDRAGAEAADAAHAQGARKAQGAGVQAQAEAAGLQELTVAKGRKKRAGGDGDDGKELSFNRRQAHLAVALRDVVRRHMREYDLTSIDIIGALDGVKMDVYTACLAEALDDDGEGEAWKNGEGG